MRIALASDHAGFELKDALATWLKDAGHDILDLGPHSTDSVDYPDYGGKLSIAIRDDKAERGIAVCGSGIGISIAVNREPACRSALVHEPYSAELARTHNDANVISLGARLIGEEMAKACVTKFLETEFAGGRHQHRVDKLAQPQKACD